MTGRGRHARSNGPGFYRDALLLVAGILVVGALVFGGLSLWAGGRDDDPSTVTTPATATTTTLATTTADDDSPTRTTAASPATSPPPATSSTQSPEATTSTVTTTPTTEALAPSDTTVVVLNSIGVTGLAGDLSAELAALGYQMAEADNYSPELSDTMIFHGEGFGEEAEEMVESIPDATVAPDPELAATWGVDIVVVIGRSYQE